VKISPNFDRNEFACKCGCGFSTVDIQLIEMLEIVRGRYDLPITITSGCRCEDHNHDINGSLGSQHLHGRAADFKIEGVEPELIANFIIRHAPNKFGVGIYPSWIHLDSRDTPARWTKT